MAEVFHLSTEGIAELKEELEYLITVKRPEAAQRIGEARGFGDLSENAEYDAAKEEQGKIEGKIMEIEAKLRAAHEFKRTTNVNHVVLGAEFSVTNLANGKKTDYLLVGTTEADPFSNPIKLSNDSPAGKALLGKKVGDVAEVVKPNGEKLSIRVEKIK